MITKNVYKVAMIYHLRKVLEQSPEVFVPTGSRVYGGSTDMSDYDFIVNPECAWHRGAWIQGLLTLANHGWTPRCECTPYAVSEEDQAYDPGVTVAPEGMDRDVVYIVSNERDGEQINLIFPSNKKEFEAWCKTTETLKEAKGALKRLISENKSCRLAAFKAAFAVHMAAK